MVSEDDLPGRTSEFGETSHWLLAEDTPGAWPRGQPHWKESPYVLHKDHTYHNQPPDDDLDRWKKTIEIAGK